MIANINLIIWCSCYKNDQGLTFKTFALSIWRLNEYLSLSNYKIAWIFNMFRSLGDWLGGSQKKKQYFFRGLTMTPFLKHCGLCHRQSVLFAVWYQRPGSKNINKQERFPIIKILFILSCSIKNKKKINLKDALGKTSASSGRSFTFIFQSYSHHMSGGAKCHSWIEAFAMAGSQRREVCWRSVVHRGMPLC